MRSTGTVKLWHDDRGWGFIRPDDRDTDLFVHYSAIIEGDGRKTLVVGQRVSFDIIDGGLRKPTAVAVTFA